MPEKDFFLQDQNRLIRSIVQSLVFPLTIDFVSGNQEQV